MREGAFHDLLRLPFGERLTKPRSSGWTMVLDKGLGPAAAEELLIMASPHLDILKLTFGTSALYPAEALAAKTALARKYGVLIMPGGTLGEIALVQDWWEAYVRRVAALGFTALEISDGTIALAPAKRRWAIETALKAGLTVISEVGKKDPDAQDPLASQVEQGLRDLEHGARMVIVEGRESGKSVGIYDKDGAVRRDYLAYLAANLPLAKVIWEAPQKSQQEELILAFGANVSLGNIPPGDILALEALRCGLRGDTLRAALRGASGQGEIATSAGEDNPQ